MKTYSVVMNFQAANDDLALEIFSLMKESFCNQDGAQLGFARLDEREELREEISKILKKF